jgi:hypothetical protein
MRHKKQETEIIDGASADQQARWLRLADIALGNGKYMQRSPGSRAIDEHKAFAREIGRLVSQYWSRIGAERAA